TPTATIVWFPPTNTPTPLPRPPAPPTLEPRPGLGDLLLEDSFDQPEFWLTASTASTAILIARQRLTLSIDGAPPGRLLFSSRSEPLLGDFYAEIDATLSLCRGRDQYGLLVRLMSYQDYYRFAVNCQGETRLERVQGGAAIPLQNWQPSGDAPRGAPAQVRLGVWAAGPELRVFLDDHYQFTVRDPVFAQGALGVFILSSSGSPVTVSFSHLRVYQVTYSPPTPSPTPTSSPTPTRTPTP
ncbi:MAG: hypothetical protein ABWK53_04690, partial [Anaerolineales bacterium]